MSKPELLAPVTNNYRESISLDGLWWFAIGDTEHYENGVPRERMVPVPSDLQDVLHSSVEKSHVGAVWFEKVIFIPKDWLGEELYIRLDQIGLRGEVYINGHEIGRQRTHMTSLVLPITRLVKYGEENRIVVRVVNEVSNQQFPLGQVVGRKRKGNVPHVKRRIPFGITGSVHIYRVPSTRVANVEAFTQEITKDKAIISYTVDVQGNSLVTVTMRDREGRVVATGVGGKGTLTVDKPILWDIGKGYLYTIDFEVSRLGKQHDMYRISFGIRTVEQKDGHVYINGKIHPLRGTVTTGFPWGEGTFNYLWAIKFFESLLKNGENTIFSCGHVLPEPFLDMADMYGVCVISDFPLMGMAEQDLILGEGNWREAISSKRMGPALIQVVESQIQIQRKHPSIIAWTAIYEPSSMPIEQAPFHEGLVQYIKNLDSTRPVGCTVALGVHEIHVSSINAYDFFTLTGPVKAWSHGSVYVEKHLYEELVDWGVKYPTMELFIILGNVMQHHSQSKNMVEDVEYIIDMISTMKQVQGVGVYPTE